MSSHDLQDEDVFVELVEPLLTPTEASRAAIRSEDLDSLLVKTFNGRIVRKDLTKQLKEGANVPVYVLEYLLGMYCSVADDDLVEEGLKNVKKILADNYVRPDEAEKVKSLIKEKGTFKIIDKVSVSLNQKKDIYEAALSNLGVKDAVIPGNIVKEHEKLLTVEFGASLPLVIALKKAKKFPHLSSLA